MTTTDILVFLVCIFLVVAVVLYVRVRTDRVWSACLINFDYLADAIENLRHSKEAESDQ